MKCEAIPLSEKNKGNKLASVLHGRGQSALFLLLEQD
jgi:hypothetical protein